MSGVISLLARSLIKRCVITSIPPSPAISYKTYSVATGILCFCLCLSEGQIQQFATRIHKYGYPDQCLILMEFFHISGYRIAKCPCRPYLMATNINCAHSRWNSGQSQKLQSFHANPCNKNHYPQRICACSCDCVFVLHLFLSLSSCAISST